jgi:hypothetical protein
VEPLDTSECSNWRRRLGRSGRESASRRIVYNRGIDSTPILDRLIPLPPPALTGSGRSEHGSALYGPLVGGAIAIAFVVAQAYGLTLSAGDSVRLWFSSTLPGWPLGIRLAAIAVAAVAGFLLAITVHELGHVLIGLCLGFRFNSIRVGRLQLTRPFRWSWSRPVQRGAAGMTTLFPVGTRRLGPRAFGMLVGGPAANLATAGAIALLPLDQGVTSGSLVFWSLMLGTMNLVPFRRGTFTSDGRRIVTLLRHPPEAQRWLAVLALTAELNDGVQPESLSSDFIAAAIAVRDESLDTFAAHILAYLTRFHRHDDARAADALEICLSHAEHLPEAIRESLMCEAAVFQARRRARPDLAEAWLADTPPRTAFPGIREQAEAAILEARGNRSGARRTLEGVEALLHDRPDAPGRDLSLRLLRRWKADLERA